MSKGPPLRLRDDPTAARALREDLARTAANPSTGYDVAAGAAKFEQTLRTGAGAGAGAGAKAALGTAIKGALLGAAVIGGAAALGDRSPAPSAAPPPPAVSVVHTATADDARSSAAPLPAPSPPPPLAPPKPLVVQALPTAASAPRARAPALTEPAPPVIASATSTPRAPEPAASTGSGDTLTAEMEHLARLRALQSGDPAEVLALAAEGNQRFPTGLFAQEREAIAIGALVRLGRRKEARARARAFLASYPRSTFAERIQKLTEIGDTP
jgi:hypothetical protein